MMSRPPGSDSLPAAVLFDLDGTLVDPAGGITGGIAYALAGMGLPVPELPVLNSMVGPKLAESLLNSTEASPEQLPELIARYRQWYHEHALAMSRPYPGIPELLAGLQAAGVPLAVATQKPQGAARAVLDRHGLSRFVEVLSGADDDETLPAPADQVPKAGIVAVAVQGLADAGLLDPAPGAVGRVVMIGDREHDVLGARANQLDCIGVGWGFGSPGELLRAGAVAVLESTAELAAELGAGDFVRTRQEALDGAL